MATQRDGPDFRARARAARGPAESRAVYADWAATYDDDLAGPAGEDYPLPASVADLVARLVAPDTDVLDVACGTGLVGAALARHGFTSLDGLDLSPPMLALARARRVYHDLGPADVARRLPGAAAKYDVLTCVNALEPGHLPVAAVVELARVVRRGGYLVLTVGTASWPALEPELHRFATRRVARVVETTEQPEHPARDSAHVVAVLEVVAGTFPGVPAW